MKDIINPNIFLNNHPINNIYVINDININDKTKDYIKLILPRIKSIAKRLSFYEKIYEVDKKFFNKLVEERIFDINISSEYNQEKVSHYCYPKYNKDYLLHNYKFMIKMILNSFNNYFQNSSNIDIYDKRLCYFKPNALGLKSSKSKNIEILKIKNFNNFDNYFKMSNFEILREIEIEIQKKFDSFFYNEKFINILFNVIKFFTVNLSFLDNFLDKYLEIPKSNILIVGSESRILSKLLKYKLINKDIEIHSYEHGARSLLFKSDFEILKEQRLLNVTKYYFSSSEQYKNALSNDNIRDKIQLSKNIEPKISKVIGKKFKFSNNKKILYIMTNTDYNGLIIRQPNGILFFHYRNIFHKLTNFLENNNYYFKIKAHPDSIMFFNKNKNYVNRPFLKLINDFDILLFDHSTSTAFCESLVSNKKIILIDHEQNEFETNFKKIVKNRCSIINADLDIFGNFNIDLDHLRSCIEKNDCPSKEIISQTKSYFS